MIGKKGPAKILTHILGAGTPRETIARTYARIRAYGDEAVFITFLGGVGLVTLPKYIFDSVQYSVDPAITAMATLLMLATTALMLVGTALRKEPK